eukprot:1097946-Prymnesium_polylepis.1
MFVSALEWDGEKESRKVKVSQAMVVINKLLDKMAKIVKVKVKKAADDVKEQAKEQVQEVRVARTQSAHAHQPSFTSCLTSCCLLAAMRARIHRDVAGAEAGKRRVTRRDEADHRRFGPHVRKHDPERRRRRPLAAQRRGRAAAPEGCCRRAGRAGHDGRLGARDGGDD